MIGTVVQPRSPWTTSTPSRSGRPRPTPAPVARSPSRWKGANIVGQRSAGTQGPLSMTRSSTRPAVSAASRRTARPSGVWRRAVRLEAALTAGRVELRVIDSGPGVPADLWPTMFAPFQRLGDRATGAGVGLGLAIVKGFCDAMGISIHPEHTPEGGLTMTLSLPVAAE